MLTIGLYAICPFFVIFWLKIQGLIYDGLSMNGLQASIYGTYRDQNYYIFSYINSIQFWRVYFGTYNCRFVYEYI